MITWTDDNIFDIRCHARVNPVNCEGVSGAGLAAAFAAIFPDMARQHTAVCRSGRLLPGGVWVWSGRGAHVILAATKDKWRDPSRMQWVESCLVNIRLLSDTNPGMTIAVPALGAGLGRLPWDRVMRAMNDILGRCRGGIIAIRPKQAPGTSLITTDPTRPMIDVGPGTVFDNPFRDIPLADSLYMAHLDEWWSKPNNPLIGIVDHLSATGHVNLGCRCGGPCHLASLSRFLQSKVPPW